MKFQEHAGRGETLSEIFILRGPGAFTGLRKAVMVANVLAHEYKIPLRAMTFFEWMKALKTIFPPQPLYVYAGGQNWHKEILDSSLAQAKEVYAFGPEAMREALAKEKTLLPFVPLSQQWRADFLSVFPKALDGAVEAFYLKEPHLTL